MRNSEILRAKQESMKLIDGVSCFLIERENGVKAKQSVRTIPLHSAVIEAGLLAYVESLRDGSKLSASLNGNGSSIRTSSSANSASAPFPAIIATIRSSTAAMAVGTALITSRPNPRTHSSAATPNWRAPIWFPLNALIIQGLIELHRY